MIRSAIIVFVSLILLHIYVSSVLAVNFVNNPSFETTRAANIPSKWFRVIPRHCPSKDELQEWFSLWELSRKEAYHGKASLCITHLKGSDLDWWDLGAWQFVYIPAASNYKRFLIFSAYLKANEPNLKVKLFVRYPLAQKVMRVGTEWHRYYMVIPLTKKDYETIKHSKDGVGKERICIGPITSGRIWIDAVQLELSDTGRASRFELRKSKLRSKELQKSHRVLKGYVTNKGKVFVLSPQQPIDAPRKFSSEQGTNVFIPIAAHFGRWWLCDSYLDLIKKANFNTICVQMYPKSARHRGPPSPLLVERCKEMLDEIYSHGLSAVVWINFGIQYAIGHGKKPEKAFHEYKVMIVDLIKRFKYHPAIIAWYIFDEPGPGKCKLWHMSREQMLRTIKSLYNAAKQTDTTRPVVINFANFLKYGYGASASDIAFIDKYCKSLSDITEYFSVAETLTRDSRGRLSWMWLHSKVSDHPVIELAPDEFRSILYQALTGGVRGFFYFTGLPDSPQLWHQVGQVNKEIAILSDLVLSAPKTKSIPFANDDHYSPVKASCLVAHGNCFLIAVNSTPVPLNVMFRVNTIAGHSGVASVMFENRTVDIRGGEIRDYFGAYDRHVYRFGVVPID